MISRNNKIIGILLILSTLITIPIIWYIGNLPIPHHRTDIIITDPLGDVSDPDVDIIEIRSYKSSEWRQNFSSTPYFFVLELTVEGTIRYQYLYSINIVVTNDEGASIHHCDYYNGRQSSYNLDVEVENSTLKMYFPVNSLLHNAYMTGLEGVANNVIEEDLTGDDRDNPIEYHHLWS
ncbi:MAG: hypothetical protein ACFFC3_10360 [Candidatus Odinarchaeota archaeon]